MNIRHFGFLVSDLKKAKHFYCDLLGFKIEKENHLTGHFIEKFMGVVGLELTYVKMRLPGDSMIFELHHWTDTDLVYGIKNKYASHMALTVPELKRFYLKNHSNIKFVSEPFKARDSNCIVCFCEDPDGNRLELVQEPKPRKKKEGA